jgi:hypothetical protein
MLNMLATSVAPSLACPTLVLSSSLSSNVSPMTDKSAQLAVRP